MHRALRTLALGVSAVALVATGAQAHHSAARFDIAQTVAVDGVVTGVRWANPHVYLEVEQTTDAGETVTWEIETVGPSALARLGWSRDLVSVGDAVSIQGNPARDGDPSLNLGSITRGPRTIAIMGLIREYTSAPPTPATTATSLEGTWAVLPNFALIGPFLPNGPKPALTEAGAAALAAFDETTMLPALQCIQSPAPTSMLIPDTKQITIGEDAIVIVGDYEGAVRTIHMAVADHEGAEPSNQGHSIGAWDGDTLVVDTTHFAPLALAHAFGVPSGEQKHLVERLTLNEEGTRIAYHFEVTDPEFLAAPIVGDFELAYRPDLELGLAECDVETAQRFAQ